jgi:signal transduction histidine kinase
LAGVSGIDTVVPSTILTSRLSQRHAVGACSSKAVPIWQLRRWTTCSGSLSPLPTAEGILVASIIRDITAHQKLEEELRQGKRVLEQADRQKDEFLAMLAHELRNPLAPIPNAIQVLEDFSPADADLQWARDVIERQVKHMTRLVDDVPRLPKHEGY